jgi:hypothetical protein
MAGELCVNMYDINDIRFISYDIPSLLESFISQSHYKSPMVDGYWVLLVTIRTTRTPQSELRELPDLPGARGEVFGGKLQGSSN